MEYVKRKSGQIIETTYISGLSGRIRGLRRKYNVENLFLFQYIIRNYLSRSTPKIQYDTKYVTCFLHMLVVLNYSITYLKTAEY